MWELFSVTFFCIILPYTLEKNITLIFFNIFFLIDAESFWPRDTKKSKIIQDLLHSFERVLRQTELLFMQFIGREKKWKRGKEMAH